MTHDGFTDVFSLSLQEIDVGETGWSFDGSELSPLFLYIAVMLASFQALGTSPFSKDVLIIKH